jgi:hypothetical protein
MSSVGIEQKSYEMPPRDGFTVTHFITVADIVRSADFYEKVFGGRILSRGDTKGASGHIQIANTWLIVNVGGGPTPDKPSVTLSVPADSDRVSSFLNIRGQEFDRASLHGLNGHAHIDQAGDKNDWHVGPFDGDKLLQIETIEARKRNVKSETAWNNGPRAGEEFLCGGKNLWLPALATN